MFKSLLLGLMCCALVPANALSSTDNEEKRTIMRDAGSEVNVVTMYDKDAVVYSDSSYVWNYCFEQMKAKHKEITADGFMHSFRCVIEMGKDEFVDKFDSASYLPMPIEINMHGHNITLNYGDYWNIDHGLTINGDGGTIKTTRSRTDYNCSIYVNGGHLNVTNTRFENFNTNLKYPIFTTGNNTNEATFTGCTFTNCSSTTYGGAICMERTTSLKLENCTFDHCVSKYGGAIYLEDISYMQKDNIFARFCNFTSCQASHSGGAVYLYNNKTPEKGLVFNFTYNTFTNCLAGSYGGAIYMDCFDLALFLDDSKIERCETNYYGGAIYSHNNKCNVISGEICFCRGQYGGGIYLNGRSSMLSNVTIHDCKADKSGGGYYAEYGTNIPLSNGGLNVYYCNFYNNSPSNANATLMSNGSLTILFGVLSGVFLITTGVFVYLYFRKRKHEKLESNN